ncbi:hypothetical protein HOK51_06415 [Candidatus Woesearchaeota archaeon]|jgi:phosphate uptake regulator|nr:hypothetical protein [Candidatus Woesearchaeota archaeon]MBT6519457.1 hypothetical protein [Candidatus Woesearchaeota archaeon]MBT7368881.1 hypothetical protein [Candidatus Woesearchaeota archaeon]
MKRKLVKQGNNALTLTVPAEWIKKYGLSAGSEVEIDEQGTNLVLFSEKEYDIKTAKIDLTGLNKTLIFAYITAAYRKGCDEIEIIFGKSEDIRAVQNVVDSSLGMAIMRQSDKGCLIKDMTGSGDMDFDTVVRRIFLLLKNMAEDSLDALKKKDKQILSNMLYQDMNVNKFANFCLRLLSKKGYKNFTDTNAMHYIISSLENIGDEYTRLCMDFEDYEFTKEINKRNLKLFEHVNEFFDYFYKLYYKFDNDSALELLKRKDKISAMIDKQMHTNDVYETKLLYHLSKIIHLVLDVAERKVMIEV